MYLIDSHAHLYLEDFDSDLNDTINKCKNNNVMKVILPSIDERYIQKMLLLKKNHSDFFYLMLGIHPSSIDEIYLDKLKNIEKILNENIHNFIGIGEIGIDLYWDNTKLKLQQSAFEKQLDIALKYNLPINIHCRNAFYEVFEILEKYVKYNIKGIFHCFSGNLQQAIFITQNLNLKLGIGGIITFKNGGIDTFLKNIDIRNIVLETDSPYLTPTPFRNKRNDPSFIPVIVNKLADIYKLSTNEITSITTKNVENIYNLS